MKRLRLESLQQDIKACSAIDNGGVQHALVKNAARVKKEIEATEKAYAPSEDFTEKYNNALFKLYGKYFKGEQKEGRITYKVVDKPLIIEHPYELLEAKNLKEARKELKKLDEDCKELIEARKKQVEEKLKFLEAELTDEDFKPYLIKEEHCLAIKANAGLLQLIPELVE